MWAPTCDLKTWRERQFLMGKVRHFFCQRGLLEVETPILSAACGTDPHLDYFATEMFIDGHSAPTARSNRYLMTSPEFHMKRLLAAGFGDCFQITRAFRNGELGPRHNCEFTMVEWYRVNFSLQALMDEVVLLVESVLDSSLEVLSFSWRQAFQNLAHIDPLQASFSDWMACCESHGIPQPQGALEWAPGDWWDYMMVCVVEPALAQYGAAFITDYPASQAALAKLWTDSEGNSWAYRFELYLNGVELCNGYEELQNATEQAMRFQKDVELRQQMGKRVPDHDPLFLEALQAGLPDCSGVALGLDRLFMHALGKKNVQDVILFPDHNA